MIPCTPGVSRWAVQHNYLKTTHGISDSPSDKYANVSLRNIEELYTNLYSVFGAENGKTTVFYP
eukprot:scaffold108416_cov29-Prasinocladus_malaysianus.AAC.2